MNNFSKLRVLLIQLEFDRWRRACHWAYSVQLGLEEGFRANGVEYFTLTTPWLSRAREICSGRVFDQVWVEIVHQDLDDSWLEWIATLAPVRIGLLGESLEYSPEEYTLYPHLQGTREKVGKRLKHFTHLIAPDEKDMESGNRSGSLRAFWNPPAIPARFVSSAPPAFALPQAVFIGALYGERASWKEHPDLKRLIAYQPSPEEGTIYPRLFDWLHSAVNIFLRHNLPGLRAVLPLYLSLLRALRRKCFSLYLEKLQSGCVVVNLPSLVKTYAARVVEGMAAGRPVISWEIPDRPLNKNLFENNREILLFPRNDPAQLADHIKRVIQDPELGRRISQNAHQKIMRLHTMEIRVRQILTWLSNGDYPPYCH